jgi:hypothetical protein
MARRRRDRTTTWKRVILAALTLGVVAAGLMATPGAAFARNPAMQAVGLR